MDEDQKKKKKEKKASTSESVKIKQQKERKLVSQHQLQLQHSTALNIQSVGILSEVVLNIYASLKIIIILPTHKFPFFFLSLLSFLLFLSLQISLAQIDSQNSALLLLIFSCMLFCLFRFSQLNHATSNNREAKEEEDIKYSHTHMIYIYTFDYKRISLSSASSFSYPPSPSSLHFLFRSQTSKNGLQLGSCCVLLLSTLDSSKYRQVYVLCCFQANSIL